MTLFKNLIKTVLPVVLNLKVYDDRHSHLVIFSTHVYDVIENNLLRTQSEKERKKIIINKKKLYSGKF